MNNNNNNKDIIKGIECLSVYFMLYLFSPFIIKLLPIDIETLKQPNNELLFNIGYELFMLIIIFLILKDTIINDFKIFTKYFTKFIKGYIKYWFIALGLMMISNMIILLFTKDIAQNEQSVRQLVKVNPILSIFLASVLAPLLEEFLFRLSLYKILNKYKWLFIILSGLIFGSMHVLPTANNITDYLFLIPYSIPGSVFAYTLYKSKNIFVPISLHFIHNTASIIIQIIALSIIL